MSSVLNDPFWQIILVILALSLTWSALRFFLRLTRRIFTCGLLLIIFLGVVLYLLFGQINF